MTQEENLKIELRVLQERVAQLEENMAPLSKISELERDLVHLEKRMEEHRSESRNEHLLTSSKIEELIREVNLLKLQVVHIEEIRTALKSIQETGIPSLKTDIGTVKSQIANWTGALAVIFLAANWLVPFLIKHFGG